VAEMLCNGEEEQIPEYIPDDSEEKDTGEPL